MAKVKFSEVERPMPRRSKLSSKQKKANIARKERARSPLFK